MSRDDVVCRVSYLYEYCSITTEFCLPLQEWQITNVETNMEGAAMEEVTSTIGNADLEVCQTPLFLKLGSPVATEDDDYDRRPQRRRYDEPAHVKLRKTLLSLAESVSMDYHKVRMGLMARKGSQETRG